MPHIIIEYARDQLPETGLPDMLDAAHRAVADTGIFEPDNIKSRLHPIELYRLAPAYNAFVAVTCRIHAGRSTQQKQQLSQAILQSLESCCPLGTVLTVEVVDMDRDSYAKAVV